MFQTISQAHHADEVAPGVEKEGNNHHADEKLAGFRGTLHLDLVPEAAHQVLEFGHEKQQQQLVLRNGQRHYLMHICQFHGYAGVHRGGSEVVFKRTSAGLM